MKWISWFLGIGFAFQLVCIVKCFWFCSDQETTSLSSSSSYRTSSGTNAVLILNSVPWCGCAYVNQWKVYVSSFPATVFFQIWRRTTSSTYQLVGENEYYVTSGTETYTVPEAERILTLTNDRIGIYVPGTQIVKSKNGFWGHDSYCVKDNVGTVSVGATVDFTGSCGNSDDYALNAYLTSVYNPPSFDNLPATITVYDTSPVGTSLLTVSASDVEDDDDDLTYSMTTFTSTFQFNSTSREVSLANTPSNGDVVLDFRVEDSCQTSGTGRLTIKVVNVPLIITNLPNYASVSEKTTTKTLLQEIQITDLSLNDIFTCRLGTITPNSNNFLVDLISGSSNYGIFTKQNPFFSYQTIKTYKVGVDCFDRANTASSFLRVFITENKTPVFLNLQNKTAISRLSAPANTKIFSVLATDEDSASISYSLSCDSGCPFNINSQGEVYTTSNLENSLTSAYDLYIYINDGVSTIGPGVLTVLVGDINTPPVILNLNLENPISLEETTPSGTLLYSVKSRDPDQSQTLTYSFSVDPVAGTSLFNVDSTNGEIRTLTTMDYEQWKPTTTFNLTVTVNDGQQTDRAYIAFAIISVNEAPYFVHGTYNLLGNEGMAGDVVGTPPFIAVDPDDDPLSYAISCPEFTINSTTKQVSLALDFDLDIAGTPSTTVCIATVSDGELSATTTLSITLNQVNDNAPRFGLDSYVFATSVYSSVGDIIGNIAATDGDIGYYGTLVYSLDQSALPYPYFSVSSNGDFKISLDIESYIGSGTSVNLKGNVTDFGGRFDTCDIFVVVQATTTTPPTTTTERFKTFMEDSYNAAWLVAILFAMVTGTLLVSGMIYHYDICDGQQRCCKKTKKKRTKKARAKRRKGVNPTGTA